MGTEGGGVFIGGDGIFRGITDEALGLFFFFFFLIYLFFFFFFLLNIFIQAYPLG